MGCTSSSPNADRPKQSRFCPIPDRFTSIAQVQSAIREAGLESSNLIVGVDFTKSNTWTGRETFHNRCLHDIRAHSMNPYQQVISTMGRTLEEFDDDKLIPAFGFGDSTTGDHSCFPFHEDGRPSCGVVEVLNRYEELAQTVKFSGPTSFAPVIREAIRIVQEEKSYHILVIIADGQVTDASASGETARAIIEASKYPLSIVVVGVGDGPWQAMEHYDDELPTRKFDNFQFVDYTAVVSQARRKSQGGSSTSAMVEARFALAALMEIPDQYAYIKQAGLLRRTAFRTPPRAAMLAPSPRSECSSPPTVVKPPSYQASIHHTLGEPYAWGAAPAAE